MPEAAADPVKPVLEVMSDQSLLTCCTKALTQSANERIHSAIWSIGQKHMSHNPHMMFFAFAMATGAFDDGHLFIGKVLNRLGYQTGKYALKAMEAADKERVRKALQKAKAQTKADRKKRKKSKREKEDRVTQKEGVLYEPGCFGPDGKLRSFEEGNSTPKKKQTRTWRQCKLPIRGHERCQPCPTAADS